ncbi:hypothetical protein A5773_12955 [Mycobacterium sp. 852014-52450_SCH5900713]|uniref:DUF7159 family protein n=1 Tax=Mycobacterium sp. 852014-52450_SCH5900713 TaxID=1834116 RepID=UPI0007FC1DE3|nr:hypothetical protein [Mycobacterium sp. 852014-52450_SCH5900713]OBF96332.1 hypothetical protein A5773_12955 [Mycobacterium sp. 852014-52450_SCH5900713]
MDVVLGVSMAPEAVRMVLVEGEAAGGVTVDQDDFHLTDQTTAVAAADRVVAAILGTRESAAQGGYQLKSSGVTWSDAAEAAALRNALAARKIENVTLVPTVMAAAALAQAAGSATNCARTALLLVEPSTATLAVVDTADGSVADVRRHPLPDSDEAALAKLTAMVSGAESMGTRPDGLFLVGSDVDIPYIKPALEAVTTLSVTTPEEPEMALARGASLAAANAQLGAPSTIAMPYAGDPSPDGRELAYSAESTTGKSRATATDRGSAAHPGERRSRKPVLAVAAVTLIFVGGVVALAVALAVDIRPHAPQRPDITQNVVGPASQAPPPPAAIPPPESAPPSPPAAPVPPQPGSGPSHGDQWDDWLHRHLGHGLPIP